MPPRKAEKVTTIRQELEPGDLSLEDRRSDEQEQDIAEFLDQVGPAGKTVKLYRLNPNTGKFGYCEVCPRDVWSEEYVRRKYGGGKFQARLMGEHNEALGSRVFEVDGEPVAPKAPGVEPPREEPGGMVRLLLDSSERRADDMRSLVTALIGALGGGASRSDPLQVVSLAKEIAAIGQPDKGVPPEQYIKDRSDSFDRGMEKGLEIGQREGRRGEGGDTWPGVIREIAGPALEAINKAASAPQMPRNMPVPVRVSPPGTPPQIPAPPPPVQEVHTMSVPKPAWFVGLEKWLPMVGFAAQQGMPPENAAVLVMQQIPDDAYDGFVDDVLGPDFVARVTPLLPPRLVAGFPEWVSQTLDAIKAAVTSEQQEQEGVDVGQGGDEAPGTEQPEVES